MTGKGFGIHGPVLQQVDPFGMTISIVKFVRDSESHLVPQQVTERTPIE